MPLFVLKYYHLQLKGPQQTLTCERTKQESLSIFDSKLPYGVTCSVYFDLNFSPWMV